MAIIGQAQAQQLPPFVEKAKIIVTYEPQPLFGGLTLSLNNLHSSTTNISPNQQEMLKPAPGHLFLQILLNTLPMPDRTAVGGKDIYLTDAAGNVVSGRTWLISGWMDEKTGTQTFPQKLTLAYMYQVRRDLVLGSTFHFLDSEFPVTEFVQNLPAPPEDRTRNASKPAQPASGVRRK